MYAYSLSCQERNDMINTTHMSVYSALSWSLEAINLAKHKEWKQGETVGLGQSKE